MNFTKRAIFAGFRSRLAVISANSTRRSLSSSPNDSNQYRGFLKEFTDEFKSSVKNQYEKNKELYEGVGLLSDGASNLSNSAVAKKFRRAAEVSSKTKSKFIEGVADAVDNVVESQAIQDIGSAVGSAKKKVEQMSRKVSQPIVDTKTAQAIGTGLKYIKDEVIDTAQTKHYQGAEEKPRREAEWENIVTRKLLRSQFPEQIKEDYGGIEPNDAKDLVPKSLVGIEKFLTMLDTSKFIGGSVKFVLVKTLNACEKMKNALGSFLDKFTIEESEEARVIKAIYQIDKEFEINTFLSHANNYIIPSILEALLEYDMHTLSVWSDVGLLARLKHLFNYTKDSGDLLRKGELVDLRDVAVYSIVFSDDKIPIITLTFQTTETYKTTKVVRNKTKLHTDVESALYVVKFTKLKALHPEVEPDIKTDGWIMLDISRNLRQ